MGRMIFVNLPTRDLAAADTFYGALGLRRNPEFSNEDATAWMITDDIWVMSLEEGFYRRFLRGGDQPAFGEGAKQMLNALSCDSRDHVDQLTGAAAGNGGAVYREAEEEMPGMYGSAVTDPDGHVWELMWMEQPAG